MNTHKQKLTEEGGGSEMNVYEALEAVVKESNQPYAQTYAKAGLELGGATDYTVRTEDNSPVVQITPHPTGEAMVGRELKVQILYVLSNLSYWRGERAKEVRAVLKKASK